MNIDYKQLVIGLRTRADRLAAQTQATGDGSRWPTQEEKTAAMVLKNLADAIEGALV